MIPNIPAEKIYDGREVPCSVKHGQIIARATGLASGDYFVLINGHNPVPLKYQLNAEYPGQFSWDYVQEGPDAFAVRIARIKAA
ncbi:MAG: DUF2249 domain-containing protein [Nibricoccus sp.]